MAHLRIALVRRLAQTDRAFGTMRSQESSGVNALQDIHAMIK
jgi:hypothetical protein